MIRVRTLWPHRIGGLTFWSPDAGRWRFIGRNYSIGEGSKLARMSDDWMGPGRERRITWWREKMRNRRRDDRAAQAGEG